jgi:Undecaprenyl-phosphate glucose phosphotransferase
LAGPGVIVIGDPEELAAKSALQLLRTYGTRELDRFELSPAIDHKCISQDVAIIDSAIKAAKSGEAEQILLALRWVDAERRNFICERLRVLPLPVFLLPDRFVSSIPSQADWAPSAEFPVEIQRAPLSRQDMAVKRILDLVLAALALLMLSPLLLITSLAIKLDSPGPVIFRQRRRGFNGQEFAIYKFRTMKVLEDGPTIRQVQRNDDRVTSLGRLLRASSIDELPQLLNVLAGEMSLVGPRPHALAHDDEYSNSIDSYALRHHVKPGITGWAQIHGFRGPTGDVALMKQRIQLDLWYINNWSFWLDLRIMASTCLEVLRPRNAY